MEIRERIAEIIRQVPINEAKWERSQEDLISELEWADRIISESLTPPLVELPCQDCGGDEEIVIGCQEYIPGDGGMNITIPCTCQNGKRAYRIMWERECPQSSDMGCLQPTNWKELCAEYGGADTYCSKPDKPLSLLDLADPDVAIAYATLLKMHLDAQVNIPNNKGKLVLKEEGK